MKKHLLIISTIFILSFAFAVGTFGQIDKEILVPGKTPLVQGQVNRVIELYEWALAVNFSADERETFRDYFVQAWKQNDKNASTLLRMAEKVQALDESRRTKLQPKLREAFLSDFKSAPEKETNQFFLGIYDRVHGDDSTVAATKPVDEAESQIASSNDRSGIDDYGFITPAGWSRSDSANKIVLSKGSENKIEFLPLVNSSGNLERDADRIFWQVFKGFDSWYGHGFKADYGTYEKGRTVQGLEYYLVQRYAKKASEEMSDYVESKFDAIVLLVKVGGKVAVIAGRQSFQTDSTTLEAIDLILYDLKFKSVTDTYNLKNDLLGSWSTASGSVALAYTFNANGTFSQGSATQFRTSRDARTDNVTTTSYGMTQSYSLSGNILTQNYKRTGKIEKSKIRIYYTKEDKDPWQHKIGFLPLDGNDGETFVLRRNK
ncbi:MAG TPA: hypothetical protein VK308_17345 [Pyrinomonadaceae bacterium]|nr:hypothetical protein [Pyrinomonadaceae bacterium]